MSRHIPLLPQCHRILNGIICLAASRIIRNKMILWKTIGTQKPNRTFGCLLRVIDQIYIRIRRNRQNLIQICKIECSNANQKMDLRRHTCLQGSCSPFWCKQNKIKLLHQFWYNIVCQPCFQFDIATENMSQIGAKSDTGRWTAGYQKHRFFHTHSPQSLLG